MDPVVHFEMPYEDRQRAADFYSNAFGWKAQMLGPEMGDYVTVATSELDENGFPKKPGSINGGLYKKPEDKSGQAPSIVIAVDDIEAAMDRVEAAGGKVLGEAMEIPGVGMYASVIDTEGNRVSLMEPIAEMKEKAKNL